jgi:hypothetical protein
MSNEYYIPRNVGPSDTRVVCIVFIDDDTKEEIQVEIGRSTHLKSMFNEYAEKVSTSLRQLRFSYNGKTLFLSSVKSQTPDDLNLNNMDAILVTNMYRQTKKDKECNNLSTSGDGPQKISLPISISTSSSSSKRKQRKKKQVGTPRIIEKTEEDLKIEVRLARVHTCLLWNRANNCTLFLSFHLFPALNYPHQDT